MGRRPSHKAKTVDELAREMAQDLRRQQGDQPSSPQELSPRWTWSELEDMDRWYQMDWFVKFAIAKNLRTLKDTDLLRWRQELAAMELRARHPILPVPLDPLRYPTGDGPGNDEAPRIPLFNMEELENFQARILRHINRLADGEGTCFGPFPFSYEVRIHHVHDHYGRTKFPRHTIYRGETTEPKDMFTGLVRHFATLSEQYCDHVRRCPHCRDVFLQFRRQQRYCTRDCQSVAVMKARRAKVKTRRGSKSRKQRPIMSGGKGGHHGKKRR